MIFAKQALLAQGWAENVRICVKAGRIAAIAPATQPMAGDTVVSVLLPALSNLHSHTFQRAMAGMSEYRTAGRDSFWTWRDLMYRFARKLTPDQVQAIAAQAFVEMQEAGFAAVGEFHYLHHAPNGARYDNPAEMSARIFAAADQTGIGLTHLPVLYSYGGAGKMALTDGQARFGNSLEQFAELLAAMPDSAGPDPAGPDSAGPNSAGPDSAKDRQIGIAPHSLRATCPQDLARVISMGRPIHIHIAEQPQEVADITAWLGARPVEWLLDHANVGPDWCLIHATHMTQPEAIALAKTGATVGLCPITEANLGDGPFNGPLWTKLGGSFGIGTDSNIQISLTHELQMLEYSQRLRDLGRNIWGAGHTGAYLYTQAAKGGARALARDSGEIRLTAWADLLAIDDSHLSLCALGRDQVLDGLIFARSRGAITDLWSAGRHSVAGGQHIQRAPIAAAYRRAMRDLIDAKW